MCRGEVRDDVVDVDETGVTEGDGKEDVGADCGEEFWTAAGMTGADDIAESAGVEVTGGMAACCAASRPTDEDDK